MKVLVAGGAGYIGSVVANQLLEVGHDVTVYDSLIKGHLEAVPAAATMIRGDILDRHEMEGPLNLTMADAGFGTYPKTYKPFFVGREAYIARDAKRSSIIVRFRVPVKGQPMPQQLDPVVDERGRVIGRVTSCAIDTDGFLLGQAFVRDEFRRSGTNLSVLVTPRREPKAHGDLQMGDRVGLPVAIEVLTRFPK